MITNFEQLTHELNEYERDILRPLIVKGLSTKIGKRQAITNKAICKAMKGAGHNLNDTRLRKIVHDIRVKGTLPFLIATSKGYYLATNRTEVAKYIKSLSERISSINDIRQALIRQIDENILV